MNLYINYRFYFYRAKISSSITSNSSCYMLKLVKKNFNTYKQIAEENLLVLYFKIFIKKKESRLDILHRIYKKKTV